VNSSVSDPNI